MKKYTYFYRQGTYYIHPYGEPTAYVARVKTEREARERVRSLNLAKPPLTYADKLKIIEDDIELCSSPQSKSDVRDRYLREYAITDHEYNEAYGIAAQEWMQVLGVSRTSLTQYLSMSKSDDPMYREAVPISIRAYIASCVKKRAFYLKREREFRIKILNELDISENTLFNYRRYFKNLIEGE